MFFPRRRWVLATATQAQQQQMLIMKTKLLKRSKKNACFQSTRSSNLCPGRPGWLTTAPHCRCDRNRNLVFPWTWTCPVFPFRFTRSNIIRSWRLQTKWTDGVKGADIYREDLPALWNKSRCSPVRIIYVHIIYNLVKFAFRRFVMST